MSRQIPEPIRAYVGLAATVLDEARKLPGSLPGLPVRVVGLAMQTALKVQQQWAGLVARGDEVLTGLRGENEPGLATFDDDVDLDVSVPSARTSARASAFDRATVDDGELTVEDTAAALDETDAVLTPEDALESALLETDGRAETGADDTGTEADALDADSKAGAAETTITDESIAAREILLDLGMTDLGHADAPTGDTDAEKTGTDNTGTEADALDADSKAGAAETTITDESIAAREILLDLGMTDPGHADAPTGDTDAEDTDAEDTDAEDTGTEDTGTDDTGTDAPRGGGEVSGSQGAGTAPVSGYDSWTVAQLRGRLRGYQLVTVSDLLAYEEATRARKPFLSMLRNRLEKLEQQAAEGSPLAPRGM